MAIFSLRSQRTGNYKEFSLLELLKLLGDSVNDEIILDGGEDVYNLSSFTELAGHDGSNGSSGSSGNWTIDEPDTIAGQDTFYLKATPVTSSAFFLLNGIALSDGRDYSRNARQVVFPFQMGAQDKLKFIYQT
jgi:hypothetical protein